MNKFFVSFSLMFLTSCTISFQNISTHGTATDVLDSAQTTSPDVKPVLTVPLTPAI